MKVIRIVFRSEITLPLCLPDALPFEELHGNKKTVPLLLLGKNVSGQHSTIAQHYFSVVALPSVPFSDYLLRKSF